MSDAPEHIWTSSDTDFARLIFNDYDPRIELVKSALIDAERRGDDAGG